MPGWRNARCLASSEIEVRQAAVAVRTPVHAVVCVRRRRGGRYGWSRGGVLCLEDRGGGVESSIQNASEPVESNHGSAFIRVAERIRFFWRGTMMVPFIGAVKSGANMSGR
jgi:hypothetical protein